MVIRGLLALLLVVTTIFSAREIAGWSRPTQLSPMSPKQRSIRFYAIFLLFAVLCLGLGGTFLTVPQTHGQAHNPAAQKAVLNYLSYWLLTGLLFLPIIPLSILDARQSLLRLEADRIQLREAKEQLSELRVLDPTGEEDEDDQAG